MPFIEILRLAFAALGANKLRSGLTMLGITIGVFSIISVMTATGALQSSIETGLSFLGSNFFQFGKYPALGGGGPQAASKYGNRRNVTLRAGDVVQEADGRYRRGDQPESFRPREAHQLREVAHQPEHDGHRHQRKFPRIQRLHASLKAATSPKPMSIWRAAWSSSEPTFRSGSFPVEDPIGKLIKINEKNFTVIGVLASKGGSFGGSDDANVLVPHHAIFRGLWPGQPHREHRHPIHFPAVVPEHVQHGASARCASPRELKPGAENDFETFTNDSLVAAFASVADAIRAGAFVISSVALVAAGVGIMNIMLVSVTERTKEIGVRKSIGAKKQDILRQFLVEAVFLSELGGLVGILLGVVAGNGLAKLLKRGRALSRGAGHCPGWRCVRPSGSASGCIRRGAPRRSIRSRRCVLSELPMPAGVSREDVLTEQQIFWMLVKKARKRDDVGRVYLAVQAAIAYGQETVDVGWLTGAMMAEGQDAMKRRRSHRSWRPRLFSLVIRGRVDRG